jgi:ribosome-associated translation inhibitor RaiA
MKRAAKIMTTPLQLTFRHVQPSPAVAARIRAAAQKLDRYYDRITGCHVVVEATQRHQRRHPYHVRIELLLPGGRLVVGRRPAHGPSADGDPLPKAEASLPESRHKDLYVAVHDAFDVARRRLEDYARKQRGLKQPGRRQKIAA